ncbi:prolyl 4-hydroxylase subunit alpha-2 [Folsomia candida]|nr:prolyl 4-hydroxylase subunit alpha-2 [Folsomia candida]
MRDIHYKTKFGVRPSGQDSYASVTAYYNLMGICSGDSFLSETDRAKLFCKLSTKPHPFFILNPIKLEVRSWSPYVAVFHEAIPKSILGYFWSSTVSLFLNATNPTTEILKTQSGEAVNILEDLNVPDDPRDGVKYRIKPAMSVAHFTDEQAGERFLNYAEMLTALNVKGEGADTFRVNQYLHGNPLRIHCDHLQGHNDAFTEEQGDRIVSFLVFLTSPEVGGGTAFPNLGFKVEPAMGTVIYWDSALTDGSCDFRMAHEGCYAAHGLRWTSVKLIRQKANILKKTCSTREGYWNNDY